MDWFSEQDVVNTDADGSHLAESRRKYFRENTMLRYCCCPSGAPTVSMTFKQWNIWCQNNIKQESPPAWTLEAYRPLCSKYSLCCPNWIPPPGGGYPDPPRSGTPPRGGTRSGTPPGGVRVPPRGGGVPGQVPPPLWTDKHLWKQYLPVLLRTRAVMNEICLYLNTHALAQANSKAFLMR